MTKWMTVFFVSLGICLSSVPCHAEKAYVNNPTKITLRRGPSIKDKILAMLQENEPVEILNSQEGWSHVRLLTPKWKNKEGWVVSGFLVSHVPWEIQVGSLKKEKARLKEKLAKIETELKALSSAREERTGKLKENRMAFDEIQNKYQTLKKEASGFLKLKKEYQIAKTKMQDVLATTEKLTKENSDLKVSRRNTSFLTGAVVMLVGLIFGLVLGRRQQKRKSSYY